METYRILVALHLLGASIWVGGHLVLALSVLPRAMRANDPAIVRDFELGYERLGLPALALQIVTGVWLAQRWIPDLAGWMSPATPQAWLIVIKLGLVVVTALLGAHARLRIIPKLDASRLPVLRAHIVAVTIVAVLLLVLGVGARTGGL
jgi:putative copper export protein